MKNNIVAFLLVFFLMGGMAQASSVSLWRINPSEGTNLNLVVTNVPTTYTSATTGEWTIKGVSFWLTGDIYPYGGTSTYFGKTWILSADTSYATHGYTYSGVYSNSTSLTEWSLTTPGYVSNDRQYVFVTYQNADATKTEKIIFYGRISAYISRHNFDASIFPSEIEFTLLTPEDELDF